MESYKSGSIISVIIPIYNSSKTLRRTLDSVLSQSYSRLQIILVNDGSTDDSLDICKGYQENDPRIVILNQDNKGVGEARNNGIDHAMGDYISFIDSDDKIDADYFLTLMGTAKSTNADIVESGVRVILGSDSIIYPYEKEKKINLCGSKEYMKNYLNFLFSISVWGKLYKRSVIGDIRFPKLNINEDFIFMWEIVKRSALFCENLNTNYSYYLDKELSLSKAPFRRENMSMLDYIKKVVNDTNLIHPELNGEALNHHNACLLHNLVLYYSYLSSGNAKELFLAERDIMLEEAKRIVGISNYLLRHEAMYDISKLIEDIIKLSTPEMKEV